MKFAHAGRDGRAQMRERQRRDRLLAQPVRVLFPEAQALRLDFQFQDQREFTPAPQRLVLHPPAQAYFRFPCPYTDCHGEFDLTSAIEWMVKQGQPSCEGRLNCQGHRQLDNRHQAHCTLVLEYRVQLLVD